MTSAASTSPFGSPPHTPAQTRVIEAALGLFAVHGVSGTSLQMIADAIGVTKAAVYHQYPTKDEIVLAVVEEALTGIQEAVETAEAESSHQRARQVLITRMIELGVETSPMTSLLQRDPVVLRFLNEHEPFRQVMERANRVLMGNRSGSGARVRAALVTSAIAGAVIHPLVQGLDRRALRAELLRLSRQLQRLLD